MSPFAGYENFAACLAANQSKSNPEAYCASIMRQVEGVKKAIDTGTGPWDYYRVDRDTGKEPSLYRVWADETTPQQNYLDAELYKDGNWEPTQADMFGFVLAGGTGESIAEPIDARAAMEIAHVPNEDKRLSRMNRRLRRSVKKRVDRFSPVFKVDRFSPVFKAANITETRDDKNQVFGWASVIVTKDGLIVDDLQGHQINVDQLEVAAYRFVKEGFTSGEQHRSPDQGKLIESMVFTEEKMDRMGIPAGTLPTGWWVGFQMPPATFAKVKDGRYRMFSIQGAARLVPIV